MAVNPGEPQPTLDNDPTKAWQGLACWRILDTQFEQGERFLTSWQAWRLDPQRPRLLHYVAFCQNPVSRQDVLSRAGQDPALAPLARELASQCFGLLPGFHRFLLDQGHVVLTLCVGETLSLLRQQRFEADAVALAMPVDDADGIWTFKALTRCCRRGTRLVAKAPNPLAPSNLRGHLTQCGFEIEAPAAPSSNTAPALIEARFNPRWELKNTRPNAIADALPVGTCAVIGAGLAGASVAAALARRGWHVTVLDQAHAPASGASGLPVGLVVPHVSADDCALSRLSRSGVRLMLQQARSLLVADQDWAPGGVLERHIDGSPTLPPHWRDAAQAWSSLAPAAAQEADWAKGIDTMQDVWHPHGAWLKPAQLVRAWLRQTGVTFTGKAAVARLHQRAGAWEMLDAQGQVLCGAERVVLANACGAAALMTRLQQDEPERAASLTRVPALQGLRGLLSWATHTEPEPDGFPPHPVNGSGAMVPHVPMDGSLAWFMGSSYQSASEAERSDQDNHLGNLQHLQALLPELASQLQTAFESGTLKHWKNTRCVTADRLPAVGPLETGEQPGLWLCAGMGSRGLSFSVLCAELLAARWGAEPWPLEIGLARSLDALRSQGLLKQ
ncbi:FAD-dependent 5-carboxymethylaminomethyl-2-thiouridine(34) oxidoreductase MnmC [Rhodoferax sp.]|uniref:FAD-dependent 5-carboxymethylaminomethyl-2-thiouridine(34) oxidoreductase MnmC n=1 Tax=Rhodoferax sp. TaxID=50421 RepID=UPI0019F5FDD5|nr:FAD-dependent 5-carboxymethylaminomethyl-2-thiouridine(34) oxidoreductase MnmC [Rhodoferax sp.]MBE0473651.1 FAD-dependent 5-carboxymethylaminomethyl-2-thiouridine(34) oxidoreductase MnmC [Rhodoferax sp.]